MKNIILLGEIKHEVQQDQFRQLTDKILCEFGSDSIIFANLNGLFTTGTKLEKHLEGLFNSGIDGVFLGEAAFYRAAGRRTIIGSSLPIVRPHNLSKSAPGVGKLLVDFGGFKAWLISVMDHSGRMPSNPAHYGLQEFFEGREDEFPVFLNVNGTDLEYGEALAWWLNSKGYKAIVFGTGLGFQIYDESINKELGLNYIGDIGSVVAENTIGGLRHSRWWERQVEHRTVDFLPEWGRLKCNYTVVSFDANKNIQNYLHKTIKI